MATHSSILAWKIPWTEKPWVHKELDTAERLHFDFLSLGQGEENVEMFLGNVSSDSKCSLLQ